MAKRKSLQETLDQPVPVVAIGASMGGLEALSVLLAELTPTTGFAFVYVQHPDPNAKHKISDILNEVSRIPVVEAGDLERILPNHLYVVPPGKDMEIIDGLLTHFARQQSTGIEEEVAHMPVDRFFVSLATRQKATGIGVILSGLDGDGTQGLKAIKEAGGITIAQDHTALYQGMPRSAIAEGVVDLVLPPHQIASELERLSQQPDIFQSTAQAEEGEESLPPDEELKPILTFLRKAVGVDFSQYKVTTIRRRIIRRMLLYKLETLKDYAQYLRQHPQEANLLYSDLLINVTSFFRDAEVMEYLKKVLFPRMIAENNEGEPLRIWVPACSTGQEAYSLAMLLMEVLGERASSMVIQIFATDLSESAIAKARLGSYSRSEIMDVSPRRLHRFFTKQDDQYRINKSIRDLCVFAPHNIFKDPPFSRVDLVSCRNLLIYLNGSLQRRALTMFHYGLNPRGYLLLGKSETVGSSASLFTPVEKAYKIFARKNDVARRASFELQPRTIEVSPAPPVSRRVSSARPPALPVNDLEQRIDALLLNQYVPASVVVNQDLDILSFRGSTALYLEHTQGRASLNLLKMARPSLSFELRNAVHKVLKSGQPVRKNGLEMKAGGTTHYVAIEAAPLESDSEDRLFLIVFQETGAPVAPETGPVKARNRRIKELEEELANVRRDMHSLIEEQEAGNEELQSANEEIVSSNEELQSINEELETSKEEIESTNEELLTINQELQVRNEQLSEAYEFAEAIFATLREATLVLDADLRVRSANSTFYEMFDVRREDVEGRLLYELSGRQWDSARLRERLAGVITQDIQIQGFEFMYVLPNGQEKVLLLNARRVVRQQRKEAILMAIEEITEHRRAQRLSQEREAWFHAIVDNSPALTWVASVDRRYTYLNRAWLNYTGRTLEEEVGQGWAQGIHPDDRVQYLATYHARFADRQPFTTEYRLLRSDGEYRWMLEQAQPTFSPDGVFNGYIGTCADVHLQKELNQELDRRVQQRTYELAEANTLLNQTEMIARIGSYERELASPTMLASDELYRLFGYKPHSVELTLNFIDAHTHPDDLAPTHAHLEQAMQDGLPFEYVRRIFRSDGQMRYLYVRGEIIRDGNGQPFKVVGFKQDITDVMLTQEKLRKSGEEFRTLVENTPDIITRWNKELKLLFANTAFEAKTGTPLSDLLGKTNQEMGQPDSIAVPYMDKLKQVFATGKPQEHYNSFPTPNGLTLYFSRMVPEPASDGTVQSVLAIARDITQLQELAENLQAILDSSPAWIVYLKAVFENDNPDQVVDFRLAVCNQKFADLQQAPAQELIGLPVEQIASLLWREQTLERLKQIRLTGEPFYEEHSTPGDSEGWTAVSATRFDGGVVVTGLDITALKRAERQQDHWLEELRASNQSLNTLEELRQHIRQRGQFLRETSHDLRGNFGVISGAASLLTMVSSEEERAKMFEMLQRNMRQATRMLTQLLDYARLESGQETVLLTTFDVAQLIQNQSETVEPLVTEKGLWFQTEGTTPLLVEGDSLKIERIVQNLVLNAIKYTRQGGITVRWQGADSENQWMLIVQDTGPGIPEDELESFRRPSSSPSDDSSRPASKAVSDNPGEGIGLSIVWQLCNLLSAQLEVESELGTGTVFRITWPRRYSAGSAD
ncbi:PAS domain S-box protein [Larkinella arboricola]